MRRYLTTALDLVAGASIVYGVALFYVPAAFIVAGAALCVVSWRLAADDEAGAPE